MRTMSTFSGKESTNSGKVVNFSIKRQSTKYVGKVKC